MVKENVSGNGIIVPNQREALKLPEAPDKEIHFHLAEIREYPVRLEVRFSNRGETFIFPFIDGFRIGIFSFDERVEDERRLKELATGLIFDNCLKVKKG